MSLEFEGSQYLSGLPFSRGQEDAICTSWVKIPEGTKEVSSLEDQGRRRIVFSGRFPSLDIDGGLLSRVSISPSFPDFGY